MNDDISTLNMKKEFTQEIQMMPNNKLGKQNSKSNTAKLGSLGKTNSKDESRNNATIASNTTDE